MGPEHRAPDQAASTQSEDRTVDLLVIGAGAGGLGAALFGRIAGLDVLLCEKTAQVGGTTASSGGIVWAPGNGHAAAAGIKDTRQDALLYLRGELGNHFDADLAEAFLDSIPAAIHTLEAHSDVRFAYVPWPDYHPDRPGGVSEGRTLEAKRFDGRRLGRNFATVRPPLKPLMLFGGLQVDKRKVDDFLNPFRSWSTLLRVCRTFARYGADRLKYPRGTEIGAGNALVAALYYSYLQRQGQLWTGSTLKRLIWRDGRVWGAVLARDGATLTVWARKGVVLATGGFPHCLKLREELSSDFPHDFSFGFEGNVGEGITAAREVGAVMDADLASSGYWQPSSSIVEHGVRRPILYGYLDRGRPGVVAVDRSGRRFVNEANSYHDVGRALHDAGFGRGNVFHFVCDRTFVWHHGLGMIRPFSLSLKRFVDNGYITVADTIPELAAKIGVDPQGLVETISRHNEFARTGIDLDFGKGSTAYNRMLGHKRASPNPNLAPISKPPFVALRIVPSTLGTAVGMKVDRDAQVLGGSGSPIAGLYACGNDMASVMRGCYPAGGITLGPALAFAFRAAMHAAAGASDGAAPSPQARAA